MHLIIGIMLFGFGVVVGIHEERNEKKRNCISYYSDMPHNKVIDHCQKILKFEKETK